MKTVLFETDYIFNYVVNVFNYGVSFVFEIIKQKLPS